MDAAPRANRDAGFTLIELLVTVVITAVLGSAIVSFFGTQMKFRSDTDLQAETQQGLVAAFDSLTRDIRLAGACLPTQPVFVPMANSNNTSDNITLRTGVMNATTACVVTTLASAVTAGSPTFTVKDLSGFTVNGHAFIGDNTTGELFTVRSLSGTSGQGTITATAPLASDYAAASGVYALQERKYSLDNVTYGLPTLVRSIDGQAAVPVAAGIQQFQVEYRLNSGCPTPPSLTPDCIKTAVPANNAEWNQVSEVIVTLRAQSPRALSTGQLFVPQATTVRVQPRNILVYQGS